MGSVAFRGPIIRDSTDVMKAMINGAGKGVGFRGMAMANTGLSSATRVKVHVKNVKNVKNVMNLCPIGTGDPLGFGGYVIRGSAVAKCRGLSNVTNSVVNSGTAVAGYRSGGGAFCRHTIGPTS